MANKIGPLPWQTPIVEPGSGKPSPFFIRLWQESFLRADAFDATIESLQTGKADKAITLTAGAGLTGGGDLSANRTFAIANTTVVPGSYTLANLTVNARGQITAASSGTVSGTLPTGGTTGQILQKFSNADYAVTWSSLTAGIVASTPTGTVSATDVQGAIAELAAEKVQGPGSSADQSIVRWYGTGGFQVTDTGVFIDNSDNVGIGITSPLRRLHVKDTFSTVGRSTVIFEGGSGGYGSGFEAGAPLTGGSYAPFGKVVFDGEGVWNTTAATQDAYFRIFVSENGSLIERLRINSNGDTTIAGNLTVTDAAYNAASWDGSTQVPTKNAVRDKFESLPITSANAQIPTLNSPWINYGAGFGGARYYKDAAGIVHIEGLIQAPGGSSTAGVTIFTLLPGYRPPDTIMAITWSGGGACRFDIDSSGNVIMQNGNTAFTSLTGISFIPA